MNKNLIILALLITNACGSAVAANQYNQAEKSKIVAVDLYTQWEYAHEVIWELHAIVKANTSVQVDDCLEFPQTVEACDGLYEYNYDKQNNPEKFTKVFPENDDN